MSGCVSCSHVEPRLEKIVTNYNNNLKNSPDDQQITLAKVDIDHFADLSAKYNIQAVPTGNLSKERSLDEPKNAELHLLAVLAIKNGKEVGRLTGLVDEDRIETMLDRLNR